MPCYHRYMNQQLIRNFCIIAHIDHGKSTLADRLLEFTGAVDPRDMQEQHLDTMELERERGITIKAQAVRLSYRDLSGDEFQLNLIDTPGHVDFSFEVSRSLAACEGAILVVDATQGIQAQTLANVYLAMEHDLQIIPVINKIDLDVSDPDRVAEEVCQAFGFQDDEVIYASAKEGTGVEAILKAVVSRIPPPSGLDDAPVRALIFDSKYDPYKGVVAYVRVFDGTVPLNSRVRVMSRGAVSDALEVGCFLPGPTKVDRLVAGEVGYIATGLKMVGDAPVGDTITLDEGGAQVPLEAYVPLKPMVFAGLYPADGEDYLALREALEKLSLNDASLIFQAENSIALGSGFRCGFLGLLHMDVIQERLEREYKLNLLATSPSVSYRVITMDGGVLEVDNPSKLPSPQMIDEIQEPWVDLTVLASASFVGTVMDLITTRRGQHKRMEYIQYDNSQGAENGGETISSDGVNYTQPDAGSSSTVDISGPTRARVMMEFSMPLSEMLADFYDVLKSRTQGYASMDYSLVGYRAGDLVKLDVLVNSEPVDALSVIVHRDSAYARGKSIVARLRELIPRQLFEVPIQASIGNRIISRANIKALRKNVLAKCYGGDVTRKRKLLEQQAQGKKRMKRVGRVEIPQEAFLTILRVER